MDATKPPKVEPSDPEKRDIRKRVLAAARKLERIQNTLEKAVDCAEKLARELQAITDALAAPRRPGKRTSNVPPRGPAAPKPIASTILRRVESRRYHRITIDSHPVRLPADLAQLLMTLAEDSTTPPLLEDSAPDPLSASNRARDWAALTEDTGVGDPRAATGDKGRHLFEAAVGRLEAILIELSAAKLGDFPFIIRPRR